MYMGKYQKANIKHHITNTANSTKTNIEVSVFQKFQFFFSKNILSVVSVKLCLVTFNIIINYFQKNVIKIHQISLRRYEYLLQ